jgi:hypothetical protein
LEILAPSKRKRTDEEREQSPSDKEGRKGRKSRWVAHQLKQKSPMRKSETPRDRHIKEMHKYLR